MTVNTPKSVTAVFLLLWGRKTQTQKLTYYRFIKCFWLTCNQAIKLSAWQLQQSKKFTSTILSRYLQKFEEKELAVSIRWGWRPVWEVEQYQLHTFGQCDMDSLLWRQQYCVHHGEAEPKGSVGWLGSASKIEWWALTFRGSSECSHCSSVSKGAIWGGLGIWTGCLLGASNLEVFWEHPPQGRPRTFWKDSISHLAGKATASPGRSCKRFFFKCKKKINK